MKKLVGIAFISTLAVAAAFAQPAAKPTAKTGSAKTAPAKPAAPEYPAAVPVADATGVRGSISGRTYTNRLLGFQMTFPATWLIPGDDFEAEMRKAGFDLGLSPPPSVTGVDRVRMNKALEQVSILLTAYRSMPGSADNAIVRISLEDLSGNPQIRDAVDYFDAMRVQFRSMKLPADFRYSETQAERLGKHVFGFLDTSSSAGKKRLYATVRKGYAILFSVSYTRDEDLQVIRKVLFEGNFRLK